MSSKTWTSENWGARPWAPKANWSSKTWKQAQPSWNEGKDSESQPDWPQRQPRRPEFRNGSSGEEDNVSNSSNVSTSSNGSSKGSGCTLTRGRELDGKTISASADDDDQNLQANADPSFTVVRRFKLPKSFARKEAEKAFEPFAEALEKHGKTSGDTLLGKDGDGPAPKAPPPKAAYKAPPPHIPDLPTAAPPGIHTGPPGKQSPLAANEVEATAVWAASSRDSRVWKNHSDEERSTLMQAGSITVKLGLEKLQLHKESVQRQRVRFSSKNGTILEDEDVCDANSVASTCANSTDEKMLHDKLGDCRSHRRPAPQPAPRSAGTASFISASTLDQQAPHKDQMDEIRGSKSNTPAWVRKWKGLQPQEKNPSVDTLRVHRFQKDEATANDRFEQDVIENSGDPQFLRNQLVQKWAVPYWKNDSGVPMAYCCICNKEAWSPAHFYSTGHLKLCLTNPQTWEATWHYPKKCYTCVEDFHRGPESLPEPDLILLQDCPASMLDWAIAHLELSEKPRYGKAASSNGRNVDDKTEDHLLEILGKAEKMFDDKVLSTSEELDLHCSQIDMQGHFIVLLQDEVAKYQEKMREQNHSQAQWRKLFDKQYEENQKLWHEISMLKDANQTRGSWMSETNNEKSTRQILEMKNEKSGSSELVPLKQRTQAAWPLAGCMNWCR